MDFTFGIITDGNNDQFIYHIIESIYRNNIPNFEIIIVGNTSISSSGDLRIWVIPFDESIKPAWITRKKNLICYNALYENIVLLHDYIKLNDDWYQGFLTFGNDFDWCVTRILNLDNTRFRDYTLYPGKYEILDSKVEETLGDIDPYFLDHCLLPYTFENNRYMNKYMYISGSYYVIKKSVTNRFLLDERIVHCGAEDLEYTNRLHRNGYIIRCNHFSTVSFLKYKKPEKWEQEIEEEKLENVIYTEIKEHNRYYYSI